MVTGYDDRYEFNEFGWIDEIITGTWHGIVWMAWYDLLLCNQVSLQPR